MNRLRFFLSMVLILLTSINPCVYSFISIHTYTFTAFVTFGSIPPLISHTGLERISPITQTIVIEGSASDDEGLSSVEINYFTDVDVNLSTVTFKVSDMPLKYDFSYKLDAKISGSNYFYYRIRTSDKSDNLTSWPGPDNAFHKVIIDLQESAIISSNGGYLSLRNGNPNDGETSLEIPSGAIDSNINISITEVNPLDNAIMPFNSIRPVAVFRFEPKGLIFKKLVKMNLLYQDINNDGITDGTQYNENTLKIMWWDGYEWRYVGGSVDTNLNVVSTKINHFSLYGVFSVPSLTDNDYRPKERIITPALSDKINDYATFGGLEEVDVVKIFDITGKMVRQLNDTIIWDGKDDSSDILESGLYIYQIKIKASGKIISGTIAIAK